MNAGGTRPALLWQAGVPWDGVTGTDRHMASHLARWADVLWLDPALSVARVRHPLRTRAWRTRLDDVAPSIQRLTITTPPFPQRPGMDTVAGALTRSRVLKVIRDQHVHLDAVVSTFPHARLDLVEGPLRVYYATDDFTAGASLMGQDEQRVALVERRRLNEADVAGAVSQGITHRWQRPPGDVPFILPNGCSVKEYADVDSAPLPTGISLTKPVAGVVGQFSPRIDLSLLEAVADSGLSLLLVGPRLAGWGGDRFDSLVGRSNVAWVGQVPFDRLASYLRLIDVGLTPYADSPFNRSSFPLKTLEYLAAGRAVLSTPLPAVSELATDLVITAKDAREFASAAVRLATQPRTPALFEARQALARQHSWSARALEFLRILGLDWGDSGVRPAAH